jgi:CMP-N-acetylneuraminic acid synthetase
VAIALVPARGGSKGLVNKNLRKVGGKTLIQRTIEVAQSSGQFREIFLDTDSPEIAEEGEKHGAKVPFFREPKLASDESQIVDCIFSFFSRLQNYEFEESEPIVLLQPTSPLRDLLDIVHCLEAWLESKGKFGVATISSPLQSPKDFISLNAEKQWIPAISGDFKSTNRQSFPEFKFVSGSVYVFSLKFLVEHMEVAPFHYTKYVEASQTASIDIDTEFDLKLANLLCQQTLDS